MAFSKPLLLLLLIAATAMSAAAQGGSQATCNGHKVTVQNLCGQELRMESIQPVADSKVLFNPGWVLPNNQHAEFPVCAWTGRLKAVGAVEVDIHLGHDDGAYYKVSTAQSGTHCRVSVTPHGKLAGTCPTAGCAAGGKCFQHESPKGDCRGVTEIKIVYYAAV